MGLTISNVENISLGNRRSAVCDIAFDASYPTGGEALTPGDVRMRKFDLVMVSGKSGYVFEYDYTNQLLKAMTPTNEHLHTITLSGTHAGNAVELSANSNDAALGDAGGTGYTGITGVQNAAAGAAAEVGNTTNLSAVTAVKAFFIGY